MLASHFLGWRALHTTPQSPRGKVSQESNTLTSLSTLCIPTDFSKISGDSFLFHLIMITQVRLESGQLRGQLTGRVQEGAGPHFTFCSSSLGKRLLTQVTFRSSVTPVALHSRAVLHKLGVMDGYLAKIWREKEFISAFVEHATHPVCSFWDAKWDETAFYSQKIEASSGIIACQNQIIRKWNKIFFFFKRMKASQSLSAPSTIHIPCLYHTA